ncbi:hypothetical protein IFM89_022438 [Coptis chinensis]|uniref:CCT domain-containing protein n=1 Tax=Coptis chinensis TaxID=261450 RepID=A0A835I4R6_9MAGN|nr:hypothetical protein IFM89_022438 [Coptis chinensis]
MAVPTADLPFRMDGLDDEILHEEQVRSLVRFGEKRKELCCDKKIRYNCGKEVPQRMHHKNGQFVSSAEEITAASNLDSPQSSFQYKSWSCTENGEHKCQYCGILELVKILLLQCVAGQLDGQGFCVMHVD